MALDSTARLANVKDSIKKFFVDNLYRTHGIQLSFDKSLKAPVLQGRQVDRWVSIKFGDLLPYNVSELELITFCCTRQDNEGFKLAQLRDTLLGYLTDTDTTDGMKRIPFYRSHATEDWTLIGALLVTSTKELQDIITEDESKIRQINSVIKWGAKI